MADAGVGPEHDARLRDLSPRAGPLVAALAAILLYHLANPHLFTFRNEQSDIVQIALFMAVSVVAARLTHDARRLRTLATTDDLTGLHNLRSFEARLSTIIRASVEARTSVCLLVLDVDLERPTRRSIWRRRMVAIMSSSLQRVGRQLPLAGSKPPASAGDSSACGLLLSEGAAAESTARTIDRSLRQHDQDLVRHGLTRLREVEGLRLIGPASAQNRIPVFTFVKPVSHHPWADSGPFLRSCRNPHVAGVGPRASDLGIARRRRSCPVRHAITTGITFGVAPFSASQNWSSFTTSMVSS
jgi:predicted signal transduction protein with EAL and GGDEF domain